MKKMIATALVGASALALAACGGEATEAAEDGADAMAAEAETAAEEVDAMGGEAAEMVEEGAETAEAAADDPVDGTGNPVGPQ